MQNLCLREDKYTQRPSGKYRDQTFAIQSLQGDNGRMACEPIKRAGSKEGFFRHDGKGVSTVKRIAVMGHILAWGGTLQEWPFASRDRIVGGGSAPPTSQLWKQNFVLALQGGCVIGDDKGSEGRSYSPRLITGLRAAARGEGGGDTGVRISNLYIEMLMKEKALSCNWSFCCNAGWHTFSWIPGK